MWLFRITCCKYLFHGHTPPYCQQYDKSPLNLRKYCVASVWQGRKALPSHSLTHSLKYQCASSLKYIFPFVDINSSTISLSSLSPQLHHFLAHDWLRLDSSGKEPVNLALVEEGSAEHMQARAEDRVGVQYSHVAEPVQWEAVKVCSSHSHCAHCVLVTSPQPLLLGTGSVRCSCWKGVVCPALNAVCVQDTTGNWNCAATGNALTSGLFEKELVQVHSLGHPHRLESTQIGWMTECSGTSQM